MLLKYGYEDEERIIEVKAEDVTEENKLDYYFCPTNFCTAKMTIRNMNGKRAPYFAAKPSAPHSDSCPIKRYYERKK